MRRPTLILVLLGLAASLLPTVAAADEGAGSVGVVPAEIRTIPLLRGTAYTVRLQYLSTLPAVATATVSTSGEAAGWAAPSTDRFVLQPQSSWSLPVAVSIPQDAQNGEHELRVTATFDRSDAPAGSGFAVRPSISARVLLRVDDVEVRDLRLASAMAETVEEGMAPAVRLAWENNGNVREEVAGEVVIRSSWDAREVARVPFRASVAPLGPSVVDVLLPGLPYGQYTATVEHGLARLEAPFKVLAPGTLAKDALLRFLDHPPRALPGQIVKIEAVVRNTGTTTIARAVFAGEVALGETLVARLDSEPLRLAPGEETRLPVYFTPEAGGMHTIRGHLAYDGWRTAEVESRVTVDEVAVEGPAKTPWWLWAGLIGAFVLGFGGFLAGRKT